MIRLSKLALPLLAATPLCHSFSPSFTTPNRAHQRTSLHATADSENGSFNRAIETASKAAASSLLALTLAFSPIPNARADAAPPPTPLAPTSTLASLDADSEAVQTLEKETRALERETAALKKKARVERGIDAYYDYEAKAAAETEARIEEAERKAELEYENDREEVEALALLELKKERDAKMASSPGEKRALEREARALLKREREVARREKRAERAERVFLAEEAQEKQILRKKEEDAKREDAKFEEVEKKYEEDAELVKEEEEELSLVKDLMRKKK